VPHKSNQFDWPYAKKKVEIMETTQNIKIYGQMECLPIWPTYIEEKGRTLDKRCGIKVRCYWEHPPGTVGNLKGICWEQRKKEKIPPPSPLPPSKKLRRKIKSRHFECMLSLPIGCMKFLFPKLFVTIFGLG
jgi:hypothetical protein